MADKVINTGQVALNNILFPIDGFVRESVINRFPAKLITGDYDYANEQILSNWIINDQRGGLLVEEMDESVHADRYWYSDCDTRFRSNIQLAPLATLISLPTYGMKFTDPGLEAWDDANTLTNWTHVDVTGTTVLAQDTGGNKHSGTYSAKIACDNLEQAYIKQELATWNNNYRGLTVNIKYWGMTGANGNFRIVTLDGTTTNTQAWQTDGSWTEKTVSHTIHANATKFEVRLEAYANGGAQSIWFDGLSSDIPYVSESPKMCEFNDLVYFVSHNTVLKLNDTNDGFTFVDALAHLEAGDPTDFACSDLLVNSENALLLFFGDSINYWSMNTSETLVETNVSSAHIGLRWDSKTWKMATDGKWWYSTDSVSATPNWTAADANGGLDDYGLTPKSLTVYRDANGNLIPYCATTEGLFAFSSDDSQWIETELTLPKHDQTGLGLVVWNDALYVSGGLSVKKYISATVATLDEMGLVQDDGLPQLRSGEIVKFIKGYNEFFALIDSTYEGANSKSQVVSWDGRGWRVWWKDDGTSLLIEDCEDAWTPGSIEVNPSANAIDFVVGSASAQFICTADLTAGALIGVEAITSLDLSSYTYVSLWIKSNVALDAGDLQLLLDDTALCASPIESINIPAVSADIWTKVYLEMATPSSCTAIISVGLKQIVDKGAFTVKLDQVEGIKLNKNMYQGIVTSVNKHQLLFTHTDGLSTIPLQRSSINPKKVSGYTYAASGIHITPRFDAGTKAFPKLATKLSLFLDDMSANETVTVTYQIDQAQGSLDGGWTALGSAMTADGANEIVFASSAGVEFYDIQFRLALARAAGTTTLSPVVKGMALSYLKLLDKKKQWSFTINVAEAAKVGSTPKKLADSLATILSTNTLLDFTFRDGSDSSDTHHVIVQPFFGFTTTGQKWDGKYEVSCIEVL
jgi:hypothetical protein